MWEEYINVEGTHLLGLVRDLPILVIARPKISSFHVISVSTKASTIMMFNPEIPQAALLKDWIKSNKSYINTVVQGALYSSLHQVVALPTDTQLKQIAYISQTMLTARPFWIKAKFRIGNPEQHFYYLSCSVPTCQKPTGTYSDVDFTCHHCKATSPKPQPRKPRLTPVWSTPNSRELSFIFSCATSTTRQELCILLDI